MRVVRVESAESPENPGPERTNLQLCAAGPRVTLPALRDRGDSEGLSARGCHHRLLCRQYPDVSGVPVGQIGVTERAVEDEGKLAAVVGSCWRLAWCRRCSEGVASQDSEGEFPGGILGIGRHERRGRRVASHDGSKVLGHLLN